jgi:hypothetical protein
VEGEKIKGKKKGGRLCLEEKGLKSVGEMEIVGDKGIVEGGIDELGRVEGGGVFLFI